MTCWLHSMTLRYSSITDSRVSRRYGDEEMKVKVRDGRVVDMSKTMDPADGGRREPRHRQVRAGERAAPRWDPRSRSSTAAGCATGRRRRSASSRRSGRCRRSARAAIPGSKSTFPRTIRRRSRDVLPAIERSAHRTAGRAPSGPRPVMLPHADSSCRRDAGSAGRLGAARRRHWRRHRSAQRAARPPPAALPRRRARLGTGPPRRDRRDLGRRRQLGTAAGRVQHDSAGRHPQLPCGAVGQRVADRRPLPVPLRQPATG